MRIKVIVIATTVASIIPVIVSNHFHNTVASIIILVATFEYAKTFGPETSFIPSLQLLPDRAWVTDLLTYLQIHLELFPSTDHRIS